MIGISFLKVKEGKEGEGRVNAFYDRRHYHPNHPHHGTKRSSRTFGRKQCVSDVHWLNTIQPFKLTCHLVSIDLICIQFDSIKIWKLMNDWLFWTDYVIYDTPMYNWYNFTQFLDCIPPLLWNRLKFTT